jgi:hypothetical protein
LEAAEEAREYYGVDALQALILNLYYLQAVLKRLRKQGYAFQYIESGEPFDPEIYYEIFSKSSEGEAPPR